MIVWIDLQNTDQLDELLRNSFNEPVAIFKHSTSCPISAMAKKRLESSINFPLEIYYLDLISYRNVSNQIAINLGIQHESPQLLLIHKGVVVYHGSHFNIDTSAIQTYIGGLSVFND